MSGFAKVAGDKVASLFAVLELSGASLGGYVWAEIEGLVVNLQVEFVFELFEPSQADIAPGSYVVIPDGDGNNCPGLFLYSHVFPLPHIP